MALLTFSRLVRLAACAAAAVVWAAPALAQPSVEQEIKAAFLYNFAKFVEWPASGTSEPFRVCVAADPEFVRIFDQIIEGETVNGRRLVRVDAASADIARRCQMLYVGGDDADRAGRLIASARQGPVLTVGDARRFVDQGGAIQFVLDNNRVRFDISMPALDRSGLKVSSKLLRVARDVKRDDRQ